MPQKLNNPGNKIPINITTCSIFSFVQSSESNVSRRQLVNIFHLLVDKQIFKVC